METALIILTLGALNIVCFFVGAKVGQTVSKGEPLEAPKIDPMKPIREKQEREAADREKEKLDILLSNIENYDGTANGQKDIPRG